MPHLDTIKNNFYEAQNVLEDFISDEKNWGDMEAAGKLFVTAIRNGNKIISCGNGGSMCDAMHFAEELTGRFRENRPALPAFALSDAAHITCVTNDFGFEHIFSRSITALGSAGDVLLAISTSGNSANVIHAAKAAKTKGILVVALTGKDGGLLGGMADVVLSAPQSQYSDRVQEIHIKIIHSLVQYIELSLNVNNEN
ncbi:D-sedoheptulose 7-phosphate isomerase [Mucilaginibacter sp.]|uniref:D-sedoheptulose 7-phosphate isomerase n=1 Tax=Mucilaginibacter sp. TaxID=1882438 RepID=UPI00284726E6|nr:D-sedoheptulose 7-phosphate isomerase [Mucilaginibacter sp.]MDR3696484.1 D-sedoheptulose 7-phosphate isomerase [Mucilaginibacter sp.]